MVLVVASGGRCDGDCDVVVVSKMDSEAIIEV